MKTLAYVNAEVRAVPEGESRRVEFVISDGSKDRYGTRILANAWQLEQYRKNPVVGLNHSLHYATDPNAVIGTSEVWLEGDKLIGAVTFEPAEVNELAERVFQKVKHGSIRGASVGFIPHAGHWGEGAEARGAEGECFIYTDVELLEWSVVSVPANPNAVRRSMGEDLMLTVSRSLSDAGFGYSFADIENMTVRDVLSKLEGRAATSPAGEGATIPVSDASEASENVKVTDKGASVDIRACLRDALSSTRENTIREALRAALS